MYDEVYGIPIRIGKHSKFECTFCHDGNGTQIEKNLICSRWPDISILVIERSMNQPNDEMLHNLLKLAYPEVTHELTFTNEYYSSVNSQLSIFEEDFTKMRDRITNIINFKKFAIGKHFEMSR